jgi:hypothetical protein
MAKPLLAVVEAGPGWAVVDVDSKGSTARVSIFTWKVGDSVWVQLVPEARPNG